MAFPKVSKPKSVDQLLDLVRGAVETTTRLKIAGAGSKSKMGRLVDAEHEINLSSLSGIQLYEPEELVLTALSGTPLKEIEKVLAEQGQQLDFEPPDFGPLLGELPQLGTIGGVIACNLAGSRRVKSGAARDHFLGFHAVSGHGEIFKSGGRVVKNVTGYDLSKIMAGSWGTLGVMTEVTLKVGPTPETTLTLVIAGLNHAMALDVLTKSLQSPNDISAAAYLPGDVAKRSTVLGANDSITALRIEGHVPSVDHRITNLSKLVKEVCRVADGRLMEPLDAAASSCFWAEVRDASFFTDSEIPLWRISLPPTEGPGLIKVITTTLGDVEYCIDWGGGLVWLALSGGSDAGATVVRSALTERGGHATLVRAPESIRGHVSTFQPLDPALDRLNRRVKASFDPRGILNPGRMYKGI